MARMTKTIARLGDKMLGAMLPKAKASACSNCTLAYVGCGGPVCTYYYNRIVNGQSRCYASQQRSCYGPYYSSRAGCC